MENYKTLDKLAYWFETEYKNLDKEKRKNLLIYECLSFDEIDNLKELSIEEKEKAKRGVLISRFLKKLIDTNSKDMKSLLYARFKSLKDIESTVLTIINDNREFFEKFLCSENKNYICCKKDGYGQLNFRGECLLNCVNSTIA